MAIVRKYKTVWVCQECSSEIGTTTTTVNIGSTDHDVTVSEDDACTTHQASNATHLIYKKEEYLILEVV